MASLHEILTIGRVSREDKHTSLPYRVGSYRRPRGAFMPVSLSVAVLLVVAAFIALGVAFMA